MATVPKRWFEMGEIEETGCFEELPIEGGDAVFLVAKEASRCEGDTIL